MDSNVTGLGAFTRLIALYVLGWFAALAVFTGLYAMHLLGAVDDVKRFAEGVAGPTIFVIAGWRVTRVWQARGANWTVNVIVHVIGAVGLLYAGSPAVAMFIPFAMLVVGLMAPVQAPLSVLPEQRMKASPPAVVEEWQALPKIDR